MAEADSDCEIITPPAKRAKPAPLAGEKTPRPRNVLLAEFEGLAKADASQALRDAGGDLDKARASAGRGWPLARGVAVRARRCRSATQVPPPCVAARRRRLTRTVNGTGHTGPSEFCATSI